MTVDALHKRMNQRFTRLGRRMNARFKKSDERNDARFTGIERQLAEVIRSLGNLTEKLDQNIRKYDGKFEHIDTLVGEYQKRLTDLERPPSI